MKKEKLSAVETAYNKMYENKLKALKTIAKQLKEHKAKATTQTINWAHVGDLQKIDELLADIITILN